MQTSSIEDRVNRLERQNRILRFMLLALIVFASGGVLLSSVRAVRAQAPKWQRTVEAEKFVLRDANGKMRATLAMSSNGTLDAVNGPTLRFYDASGTAHAELNLLGEEPILNLFGASGKGNATLLVVGHRPMLTLADPGPGPYRAILDGSADGPNLTLRDSAGFATVVGHAALTVPSTGEQSQSSAASIHLFNNKHKVIWAAP